MDISTAIVIILILFALPHLFGALKEGGHLKMPGRRKQSTFRQFPTFDVDDEE